MIREGPSPLNARDGRRGAGGALCVGNEDGATPTDAGSCLSGNPAIRR